MKTVFVLVQNPNKCRVRKRYFPAFVAICLIGYVIFTATKSDEFLMSAGGLVGFVWIIAALIGIAALALSPSEDRA